MIVLKGSTRYRVERVAFSPCGTAVLAPLYSGIQVWNPFVAGGPPWLIDVKYVNELHFADARTLFATNVRLNRIEWPAGTTRDAAFNRSWPLFAVSHTGDRYLAQGNEENKGRVTGLFTQSGVQAWERTDVPWLLTHPRFLPGDAEFVAVELTGEWRTGTRHIVTRATDTGDELRRSKPLAAEVSEWVLSPDGALAACRHTVWVHVYPLRESFTKPLATLHNTNRKEFTGIAFHPGGKYLGATSNDETVKLYDTATWDVAHTFTWKIGRMRSVCFSPDGSLAAAGSDKGQVVVWDVDL
jgi:WD40 repeat protein